MIKRILIITICCLIHHGMMAQKLMDFVASDTNVYVYKVNREQLDFMMKHLTVKDTSFLFTNLFKTFPARSYSDDRLPIGNFIVASIYNESITYRVVVKSSFKVSSRVVNDEVVIFVSDEKTTKNLINAKVEIDGKKVPFNEGLGGYSFPWRDMDKKQIAENKVFLQISLGEEYGSWIYTFQEGAKPVSNNRNENETISSDGFMVTDKPIYKPGDTLRLKAFMLNPFNGRPIRKKARITLTEPQQQFSLSKKIKPHTPGAFLFNWPFPDTLKIDRNFLINLQYKKRGRNCQIDQSVYLENYVLSNNTYNLSLANDFFLSGEDILFYVSAKDANQFPIQGTQIRYQLSIVNVNEIFKDTLMLSQVNRSKWLVKDTVYPYENFMELKIPSDALPALNGRYRLEVSFTDPNSFERKVIVKEFEKDVMKEKLMVYQREDSAFIRCLNNQQDVKRPFTMIVMSNQDTLLKKNILSPYVHKLSPYTTRVLFIDKDSVPNTLNIAFSQLAISKLQGKRSGDSMLIAFKTPFDEPIYYTIYQGDKKVKFGMSKSLDFKVRDNSDEDYTIILTTNNQGAIRQNFYKLTYVTPKHKIKLSTNIPSQAFPGQSLPITIQATDYKNKPLSNINLTSYAVNSLFGDQLVKPFIQIPLAYQDLVQINPLAELDWAILIKPNITHQYPLTNFHVNKYSLRKNEYYALRFPEDEYAQIAQPIESTIPEFMVSVKHNNALYTPKYILLDGVPVYISDLNKDVYSFPASVGTHRITFRYFNKKIVLKDVKLEQAKKYWISVNIDSLKRSMKRITITDSLPAIQPNDEEKELLYESLLLTDQFYFDTLLIKNKRDSLYHYIYTNNSKPSILNIDGESFYAFGPLLASSNAIIKWNGAEHTLKVSSAFAHYHNKLMHDFTSKHIGLPKGIVLNFRENLLSNEQMKSLFKPNKAKPSQEVSPVRYNNEAMKASTGKEEPTYAQSWRNQTSNQVFNLFIQNDDKLHFVKSMWVISQSKYDASDFVSTVSRVRNFNYGMYGADGKYDIYLLMNNHQLAILKDVQFQQQSNLYIQPKYLKTVPLSNEQLSVPLRVYKDLVDIPLKPFYFHPKESEPQLKEVKNGRRKGTYLNGIITNGSLEGEGNVFVILEVNGRYMTGAITNNNGAFEILDLPSGTYQIKLYHPQFQMIYFKPVFLKQGNDYSLNASLKETEASMPVYENIHKDFRFMGFKKREQQNLFLIKLYDKETRVNIDEGSISIYLDGRLIDLKEFKGSHMLELPFPISQTNLYKVEVRSKRYASISISNVKFVQGLAYELHVFMTPNDLVGAVKSKEFNIDMQSLPIEWQEEVIKPFAPNQTYSAIYGKNHQVGTGQIYGKITDEEGKALHLASVGAFQDGILKSSIKTDLKGNYKFSSLPAGKYDVRISLVGYKTSIVQGIVVLSERQIQQDVKMVNSEVSINEAVVVSAQRGLVDEPDRVLTINATTDSYTSYNSASAPMNINYSLGTSDIQIASLESSISTFEKRIPSSPVIAYGEKTNVYVDAAMIESFTKMKDLSGIRKRFSDVGFWEPNRITNKYGKASFEIRLPDNLTTWKSFVIAMGKFRLHAVDSTSIKVYKPLQTTSILPAFLWDQDKVLAKVKYANLTKEMLPVSTSIFSNNKLLRKQQLSIKNEFVDSVYIAGSDTSFVDWNAGLEYKENYQDREVIQIPVYSSAMKHYSNRHFIMNEDSTYKLHFPEHTKGKIILNNQLYEKILEEINQLSNYEYGCVEQTCSKLKGLLCKERINKVMGIKENLTPTIYGLINRLVNYQQSDGTWGWWKYEPVNWRMTIYALEVLTKANEAGYNSLSLMTARDAVIAGFQSMNTSDKIFAAYTLHQVASLDNGVKEVLERIDLRELNNTDKLYLMKLRQSLGQTISNEDFYALFLEMNQKMNQNYEDNFFYDTRSDIYTAYKLFSNTSLGEEWLKLFKTKLQNGQLDANLNTYSRVAMIDALTSTLVSSSAKPIQAQVIIDDSIKVKSFPYSLPIRKTNYRISHTGGEVFLNTAEEQYRFKPDMKDSIFKVSTKFIQANSTEETLKIGAPCVMEVSVAAYRTKDYVMLEIPIPSGMRVIEKMQQTGCTIEYLKTKVLVFYQKMSMGTHSLQINLMPFLKGDYVLPPSKCSLMYYPFIFGNNETKYLSIK